MTNKIAYPKLCPKPISASTSSTLFPSFSGIGILSGLPPGPPPPVVVDMSWWSLKWVYKHAVGYGLWIAADFDVAAAADHGHLADDVMGVNTRL